MECPVCNNDFERLGQHWAMSCEYPKLDSEIRSILSGLLMGDGHVPSRSSKYSQMRIRMTNERFLRWLSEKLEYLSTNVRFIQSAEKSAEQNRKSGFRPNAKAKNYSDVYELNTRSHPYFTALRENWYIDGNKTFNKYNLLFNSLSVKMWYVTDGYLCKREKRNPYAAFRLDSQSSFAEKISERFKNQGIKASVRNNGNVIAISSNDTRDFLEWIGKEISGFEYKWI